MDLYGWLALAVLAAVVTLLVTKWIPMGATALAVPVVLAATGILPDPDQALVGFTNHAVIAIGAVFVLSQGLKEAGVATLMARGLQRVGGSGQGKMILIIMLAVAGLSAFMSSTATVAVFLPAVAVLARRTQIPKTHLMMPLSYAAIMGGTLTLIGTTPNLILHYDLVARTDEGIGMFRFAVVGLPVTLLGIAYMATIGRRLLPAQSPAEALRPVPRPEDLARDYDFGGNLYRMRVVRGSRVADRSVADIGIGERYDLALVLVFRPGAWGGQHLHPEPDLVLRAGDEMFLEGDAERAWEFADEETVQFGLASSDELERVLGRGLQLAEVTLSPRAEIIGKTIREVDFRRNFGVSIVSVWRAGTVTGEHLRDHVLELGDAFLVSGPYGRVRALGENPDLILMTGDAVAEDVRRAPLALGLLLLAVIPPILGWLPFALSAMAGALLMVLTGCTTAQSARRAVDWRVLFLIVGTIPLGVAMEQRGVADQIARLLMHANAGLGGATVLLGLFLLSAILSLTCNNGAAAVILSPVAYDAAAGAGLEPVQAFLAVAYGASCAFLLPFGNQCNLLVMGPAGYGTRDYVRAGAGLTVLVAVATVGLLTLL